MENSDNEIEKLAEENVSLEKCINLTGESLYASRHKCFEYALEKQIEGNASTILWPARLLKLNYTELQIMKGSEYENEKSTEEKMSLEKE